jgi:hypothetical protein
MFTLLTLIACSEPAKVAEPVNPQITDSVTVSPQELAGFSPLPANFFQQTLEIG